MLTRPLHRYTSSRSGSALLPFVIVVALLLVCATTAEATLVHKFQLSFGSVGSGPGQFDGPSGVAVNDSTGLESTDGDVYVVDAGNNRVERFSASGKFLGWFNGSGEYEVEEKIIHGAAAPTGALSEAGAYSRDQVAVDDSGNPLDPSAGDVYVVDEGHAVVDKFSATGEYIGQIDGSETALGRFTVEEAAPGDRALQQVAVDPNGTLWIGIRANILGVSTAPVMFSFNDQTANRLVSEVGLNGNDETNAFGVDGEDNFYVPVPPSYYRKYAKSGELLQSPFGGLEYPSLIGGEPNPVKPRVAAVDASRQEVYLDSGVKIEAFTLAGEPIESDESDAPFPSFGLGPIADAKGQYPSVGLAVNTSSGVVYATDRSTDQVAIFEALALPTVTSGAPSARGTRGVTLNGTVNPEGAGVTGCVFEYDTRPYGKGEGPHGASVPCVPDASGLGEGTTPVPVSASLSGLSPQTTYYYRLVAENKVGRGASAGQEVFMGPRLGAEWASQVAAGSATLSGRLDPEGADTHYYFQYGIGSVSEASAPIPPPGVDMGSGEEALTVSVHLQGLRPGASYHYRLVAVQDGEELFGAERLLTTQPAATVEAALADGRSWELVSPPDKHGALIELSEHGGPIQAAADGGGIAYITQGTSVSEAAQGKSTRAEVLSMRGPGGWSTTDLTLPERLVKNMGGPEETSTFEDRLFSRNLGLDAVQPPPAGAPPLSPEATERTLYLRDDETGAYLALVTPGDVPPGTIINLDESRQMSGQHTFGAPAEWGMDFLAATPELQDVVFDTPSALTENAIDEELPDMPCKHAEVEKISEPHCFQEPLQRNIYEWAGGVLRLVNILPESEGGGVAHGKHSKGFPVVRLPDEKPGEVDSSGGTPRPVSDDGRRIAWTWGVHNANGAENEGFRGLFVRDMVEERTVRVGGASATYQTMNGEGTRIFYLEDGELYEYEWEIGAEAGTTTDLTATHEAGEASAEVQETVSDVSEDGSYVYFVATGALAPGGVKGEDNLYLLHDTNGGWSTTFIAALAGQDKPSWFGVEASIPGLGGISSRVSPDGRYLAFMSSRSLTGYDNTDLESGAADEEVFLYDSQTGRLVCASCDPTGARPVGIFDSRLTQPLVDRTGVWSESEAQESDLKTAHWLAGSIPGWDHDGSQSNYQPRYLSDSGRLFFDSPVGLVPEDVNGLEDVYEFEPAGVGSCSSASVSARQIYVSEEDGHAVGGCVGLISSGTSGAESAFYDASENGDDVFFDTTAKLVGADYDKGYDLYDAHVCAAEGVPCTPEAVTPPECRSEAGCRAAPIPEPAIYGAPPSQTFEGIGDVSQSSASRRSTARALTRAQTLTRALARCQKKRSKGKRAACERSARRRYAARGSAKAETDGRAGR